MASERKELGKIQKCHFGQGGYQDACIGVTFTLGGDSWGVGDFWGAWAIERSDRAKWTEADRITQLGEMVMRLNSLLANAKVSTVDALQGIPVEVTFDGMALESWRVLKEVL